MIEIRSWLRDNGFERFADLFEENEIDFDALSELSDDHLKELGIPLGPRVKLLKAINALGVPSVAVAPVNEDQSPPASPAPSHEAERRQLTVMFVDLVGSTALSGKLDPEEMRVIITSYQNTVAGVVTRFEGHVAKYMGDGVLCYFGWPRAHEDDAERAVRAGLAIMQSMAGLEQPDGEALAARAGIATGVVVVGDLIGEGAAQEEAVVGETPNLAARVQELAEPGLLVVAEPTRHLLGDVFEVAYLGDHELKGISGKTSAYAVTVERPVESRFEARSSGSVSEMVGRDHELALMLERWNQAKHREGQLVLLSGEAGIGKSRISRAMIDTLADQPHIRLSYQCSPYHTDSALFPVIQQLTFAAGIKAADSSDERLDKLEAVLVDGDTALFAALLGLEVDHRYAPLDLTPQQQRARTLQALADQLISLSRKDPVLFVLEDAHWIDATTLELLDLCLDQVATARVLMLLTTRPTFEHGFGGHPIVTKLALNRLGREQVLDEIAGKTDGVPLFVEELTKAVLESGELEETADAYELTGPLSRMAIPATLHDSLMARLDRLHAVKELAQTAACIGREFDFPLIASITPFDDLALEEALDQLVAAELIFRRGVAPEATYTFKHALVRDAAYESLLKSRRQTIHQALLKVLETREDVAPELLAHHATEAGLMEKAIRYWRQAGNLALARPAYDEAVTHFTTAIGLVTEIQNLATWQQSELELQVQLAQVLLAKHGYGSAVAGQAFERAAKLLEDTGNDELLVPVNYGLWIGRYIRGEHEAGRVLVAKLVDEIDRQKAEVPRLVAHRMMAASLIALGRHQEARGHLEISLDLYKPDLMTSFADRFAQEPGVQIRSYLLLSLWMLGYVDQAAHHVAVSQAAAKELAHVNTTCYGSLHWMLYAFMSRDDQLLQQSNGTMVTLGAKHGLITWQDFGEFGEAILRSRAGDPAGLERLQQRIDGFTSLGDWLFVPFFKTEQAREFLRLGRYSEALDTVRDNLDIMKTTGECWTLPELHRIEGLTHLAQSQPGRAEASFQKAIEVAQEQEAKSWELRAATSLAQLWSDQGERAKARDLLRPVYDWFTEGFDTPDLKDAKALLDQLG
jgi:predicted ATPase/class 3 adenylate cyclase